MRIGYFLSSEEYSPADLLEQARLAERAGFTSLWISDHYHPWNDAQGQSPFVWSMIGALSQVCSLPITTAVTCPIMRMHPVNVAQAAATSSVLTGGRFVLGVGSGVALNEHILGQHWPSADVRLEMLEEAIGVIRELWGGDFVSHRGVHFTVENARVYTLPSEPIKIYISGFGPRAVDLAGRVGDGYVTTKPDRDLFERFHKAGGAGKPTAAGFKCCYAETRHEAVGIAHRLWATSGLPGELGQVLPSPAHFEQAAALVTREMTTSAVPCGPAAQPYLDTVELYREAGVDELYVAAIGPHYRELIDLFAADILPRRGQSG
jgi:G6PDH family F420-dependent oxidoreductase